MNTKELSLGATVLALAMGCQQKLPQPNTSTDTTSNVTIDDVKRDASKSMNSVTAYSQQEKDKLMADMRAQMAEMDASIERLRLKGKDLASDAKANWQKKMADLETKRKLANERIDEIGKSTSMAWSDVEKGARSAWDDLAKAVQEEAANEF